jgi:hypothetical protein
MDDLLRTLEDFLRRFADAIAASIASGDFLDQMELLGYAVAPPIAFLLIVLFVVKLYLRRKDADRVSANEEKRRALAELAREKRHVEELEARNDALLAADPDVFLRKLAVLQDEGRPSMPEDRARMARAHVQHHAPALARAYAALARHGLTTAKNEGDLAAALHDARGAVAAEPAVAEWHDLCRGIEEAQEAWALDTMSDAEAAEWRLARMEQDPAALLRTGQRFVIRGRYRLALILFDRAEEAFVAREGADSRNALAARGSRVFPLGQIGRARSALSLATEVWEAKCAHPDLGAGHPQTLVTRNNMAQQMGALGRHGAALDVFTEVWEASCAHPDLGAGHPETLVTRNAMAQQMGALGRHRAALDVFTEVWEARCAHPNLRAGHPQTLVTRNDMAQQMGALGRHREALDVFTEVWEARCAHADLGAGHPETLLTRNDMAQQMGALGRHGAALDVFTEVWEARCAHPDLVAGHPQTLVTRHEMARQMGALGRHREALEVFTEVWEALCAHPDLGATHPWTLLTAVWREIARAHATPQPGPPHAFDAAFADWREGEPDQIARHRLHFERARLLDLGGLEAEATALLAQVRREAPADHEPTHELFRLLDSYEMDRGEAPDAAE